MKMGLYKRPFEVPASAKQAFRTYIRTMVALNRVGRAEGHPPAAGVCIPVPPAKRVARAAASVIRFLFIMQSLSNHNGLATQTEALRCVHSTQRTAELGLP